MVELTRKQIAVLEDLIARGFAIVAFPLYGNAVGIRKGNCAALLEPLSQDKFRLLGEPCILLEGNLTVRIYGKGSSWFVWKKQRIEATLERLAEVNVFAAEVQSALQKPM